LRVIAAKVMIAVAERRGRQVMPNSHPALQPGNVVVITGAAGGIGLAVAQKLARFGLRLCLADYDADALAQAAATIEGALAVPTDVSDRASVEALARQATAELGPVAVLMNNAGTGRGGDALSNPEGWSRVLGTNFLGVLHGVQAFVPAMAERGTPGLVINTGSKQGITTPPGDTAYNVSKAGVKVLTEGLAHTLRSKEGCRVSAHLLIPGFTYTRMISARMPDRPASAWDGEQVANRLIEGIERGEFYILCQDNETTREQDEKRILWAAQDLTENRPALSRWHPDWKERFDAYMAAPKA
jgi:NAD(P)-dependent dehydrogenase (short-subunit alcohol dehydrogenase family)